ncbi:14871_t:CDS:2, partial [Cetraspora pellucida]
CRFIETHSKLASLNTNILSLQNIYQSTFIEEANNFEFSEQNNNKINNFISSELFYNIDNIIFS